MFTQTTNAKNTVTIHANYTFKSFNLTIVIFLVYNVQYTHVTEITPRSRMSCKIAIGQPDLPMQKREKITSMRKMNKGLSFSSHNHVYLAFQFYCYR